MRLRWPGYAGALGSAGRQAENVATLGRAVDALERAEGRDHPDVARLLHNRALGHRALGDYASARADLRRALAVFEASGLDEGNELVRRSRVEEADLARIAGQLDDAVAIHNELESVPAPGPSQVEAIRLLGAAELDIALGAPNFARDKLAAARTIRDATGIDLNEARLAAVEATLAAR